MAALCRSHAGTAGCRFLKALVSSKPLRNASTEGGSESSIQDSSAPRARSGGFASALERHSELQRKAELGPVSRPRGATSRRPAERGEGLRGSRRSQPGGAGACQCWGGAKAATLGRGQHGLGINSVLVDVGYASDFGMGKGEIGAAGAASYP